MVCKGRTCRCLGLSVGLRLVYVMHRRVPEQVAVERDPAPGSAPKTT